MDNNLIPDMVIDLGNFDISTGEQEYPVAEAGEYLMEVVKEPEWSTSKSGNPMLKWQFAIHSIEFSGVRVFDQQTFTEKSLVRSRQRLADFLKALGIEGAVNARNLPPVKGRYLVAKVLKQRATWQNKREDGEYPWENKIESVKLYDGEVEEENTPEEVPF